MKYFYLVWKNLWRRKLRTFLTVLSTMVAFVLFALLAAVRTGFLAGVDVSGVDRLMVTHKITIILPLPVSYQERIKAVSGVEEVTHATWFGGIYQDPKNFFGQMAVDPETFLALYPEYRLPEAQKKAWFADRAGAIVGRATADRFGWKVGDRIPLDAPWPRKDGTRLWTFNLVAIYDGAQKETDTTSHVLPWRLLPGGRRVQLRHRRLVHHPHRRCGQFRRRSGARSTPCSPTRRRRRRPRPRRRWPSPSPTRSATSAPW